AVLWGLWRVCRQGGEFRQAREMAEELLSLAQPEQDPALLIQAHHANWTNLFLVGEFASAREHAEQGIALYSPGEHHAQAFLFGGHDPCVCGLSIAAQTLWALGYPDQALNKVDEALTLARELNHPSSLALAVDEIAQIRQRRGEAAAVREGAEALVALSTEQEFGDKLATGIFMRGWALTAQGQGEDGLMEMRRAQAEADSRAEITEPYFVFLVADACARMGRAEEGFNMLAEALAQTDDTGMRYWEAELHRLKGEMVLALTADNHSEAEACFRKAIEVARRQNARSLELRAAMSLGRLWRQQGKSSGARELLAPVYDWFTEGFDTADLREAKTLLEELA
ncbi:MAG: hypothetical protein V3S87_08275, partial [Alphaproteobacteria bacterium]